jgi:parallel beta-helix repeat protein
MTTMAKLTKLCGLLGAACCLLIVSCSNPVVGGHETAVAYRVGDELDLTLNQVEPSPSGRPWVVRSTWTIEVGRTVTILPGTEIMFRDSLGLDIPGQLIAEGTSDQPIIFTSAYVVPKMGQWRGFKFRAPVGSAQSSLKHCIVTYGGLFEKDTTNDEYRIYRGVFAINNSSPLIERCVVYQNQNNGVYVVGSESRPHVRYNIFSKNDASGVRAALGAAVNADDFDIRYNAVGDNQAPMLMADDTAHYGKRLILNANLDSVDFYYNVFDREPLMIDPDHGDFALQSCSPCIDGGAAGEDLDPDHTRADMGTVPYIQVAGELRGVLDQLPPTGDGYYRMSCHVRVDSAHTLVIPAGTHIDVTGLYDIDVHGRLVIEGTNGNRVFIGPNGTNVGNLWGGVHFLARDLLTAPSTISGADFVEFKNITVLRGGLSFSSCRFEKGFDYGVWLNAATATGWHDSVSFQNCVFDSCGDFAVLADSSAVTVRNSVISGGRGRGLSLRGTDVFAEITNTIIRNNVTSGIIVEYVSHPNIINCLVQNNNYHGIYINEHSRPLIINSISVGNGRYGIFAEASSEPMLSYNDVYDNNNNDDVLAAFPSDSVVVNYRNRMTDYGAPPMDPGAGSISRDPRLADDGQLLAGSPCVDAGNPDPAYNDPNGSRNDIGAYGGPGSAVGVGTLRMRRITAGLAHK